MDFNWFTRLFAEPFDEVSYARLHAVIHKNVEQALPDGFQAVGDCKWVRDKDLPIRQVFTFSKLKGGVVKPVWGVSLDFVPHISGKHVRWHKSNKAAKLDLCYDPRGKTFEMPCLHGTGPIMLRSGQVVRTAAAQAQAFWSRCETIAFLPDAVEWLKQYYAAGNDLGFYSYTQHFLTVAFIHKGSGCLQEAMAELDRQYSEFYHPEAWQRLRALVASETAP